MNQVKQEESGISIKDLLYILRKKIILLIVVVFVVSLAGVLYSRTQKPKYTASELVFLKAINEESNNITDNVSAMIAYIETIVDFCDEGAVVDRANYHYDEYIKMKTNGQVKNVDEYIKWSDRHEYSYQGQEVDVQYFSAGKIKATIGEKTITGNSPFNFSVSYVDDFSDIAKDKVKILVHSLKLESVELDDNYERKYFYGVEIEIVDEGLQGVSSNVSRTKTIILFCALGVVLGIVAVYVSYYLDNTVKTKEELERLTGAGVMSVIDYQGGDK